MYKRGVFFFIFLFVFVLILPAQPNHSYHYNSWGRDWDDLDIIDWDKSNPFIEINYGFGTPKHKKFNGDFGKTGLAEIRLGYGDKKTYYEDYVVETDESYFFGSNLSTDLSNNDLSTGEIETKLWRFGIGYRDGFGYQTEGFAVIPYYNWALTWSRLETDAFKYEVFPAGVDYYPGSSFNDYVNNREIINRYRDSFRFGTFSEGGIRFEFADFVSLDASYEASVIYPRHLVWKQAGSFLIEHIGIILIDDFVDGIFDSTPAAAPVVSFLLKNGFSYGFYQLKRDDMNWPFKTETPLTYETFKVGMTFTF